MLQNTPTLSDFLKKLFSPEQWTLDVYLAVFFFLFTIVSGVIVWLISLTLNFCWNYYKQKTLEKSVNPESYTQADIKSATNYYIRPLCTTNVDPANEDEPSKAKPTAVDLFKYVDEFLDESRERRFLIVLADSGMGKTSFALNYFARNKSKWLFWKRKRLALIHLGSRDAIEQINALERKNETDLILDAFDEDTKAIEDYRTRIEEIFDACSNFKHVIITSRTQFFPKDDEIPVNTGILKVSSTKLGESKVYELHKLYLVPFGSKQINKYLKKRFPYFWNYWKREKAKTIVEKIPLLSVRPMLLTHIPDLLETKEKIKYAFQLYETLIEKWLERETYWVNKENLRKFSEELAVDLHINRQVRGSEGIPRKELAPLARKYNVDLNEWQLAGRSLLNRDALGNYRFSHRSIMEYFFIVKFLAGDDKCKGEIWTDMMERFVADFFLSKSLKVKNLKLEYNYPETSKTSELIERSFPLGIIIRFDGLRFNLQGADFSKTEIMDLIYESISLKSNYRLIFSNIDLSHSNFENTDLSNILFVGCDLSYSNFQNCRLQGTEFYDSFLVEIDLMKTKAFSASFINCNLFNSSIPTGYGVGGGEVIADMVTAKVNCVSKYPTELSKYRTKFSYEE